MRNLFVFLLLIVPFVAYSYDFERDGICYNVISMEDKTISVTSNGEVTNYIDWSANHYSGSIIIPETVEYNGDIYTVISIGSRAFQYTTITDILLPHTIKTIEEDAFCYTKNLRTIDLPSEIIEIGPGSFSKGGLEHINMPNSIEYISEYAFYGSKLTEVIIPESIKVIGCGAFMRIDINKIVIPKNVEEIREDAFLDCEQLAEVIIMNDAVRIGKNAFANTPWLQHYSQDDNNNIDDILYINNTAYFIDENKKNKQNFYLVENTQCINDQLFYNCYNIKEFIVSDNVEVIGNSAFENCSQLKKVLLGKNVASIGDAAFSNTNINDLSIITDEPPICGKDVFDSNHFANTILSIPVGSKSKYLLNDTWSKFQNIVEKDIQTIVTDWEASDVIDFVDLDLPSGNLWASYNIGAVSPSQAGEYYAWGETKTKSNYSLSNYIYIEEGKDPDGFDMIYYKDLGPDIANTEYDVVHSLLGSSWHMPTNSDFEELFIECSLEQKTLNGVNGLKVTSKNGKWIFFPEGAYWTSIENTENTACSLWLPYMRYIINTEKYRGHSIRPVKMNSKTNIDSCKIDNLDIKITGDIISISNISGKVYFFNFQGRCLGAENAISGNVNFKTEEDFVILNYGDKSIKINKRKK